MKRICLSYNHNGKESDYIPVLKAELESRKAQIYELKYLKTQKERHDINSLVAKYDKIKICDILIAFLIDDDDNFNINYDIGYAMSKALYMDKKILIVTDNFNETSCMTSIILWRDYLETSRDILNFVDNC